MRHLLVAASLTASLLAGGCAGTDVELRGGVFDMLGVSDLGAKREEPKLADRPGLVVPPSTASLPPPGARQKPVIATNGEPFPVNPEDRNKIDTAQIVAKHKAFCEQARQRYEAGLTPMLEQSPWGSCEESILRNVTGRDLAGNRAVGAQ